MTTTTPVGPDVAGWQPARWPDENEIAGRLVRLERLSAAAHAAELHAAFADRPDLWTYMGYGPFATEGDYRLWAEGMEGKPDPCFYAIRDLASGRAAGVAAFLRITPEHGAIEVGHICLSPALQGTRAATEAMMLMMRWAFANGYRRYEWKCDALNRPSRRAAERFGFSYEGTFRQHMIYKGRNRDTAWFAMTDGDWAGLQSCYDRWLDDGNFDAAGQQRESLSALTRPFLATTDPDRAAG
ncbi:GNAT family protein [Frigidibacter sp. RF13]|uniref:GNAT family N-acetyltransferase n=1 Tax=Frigidibacter sp. RF13 TaxID=2997340 RepID=UPI002270B70C|nr:GNAT family protein [Frigidibacter sp. RF13]MCY1126307.1 GNAT family protein [Frigidibacter sp. RF13]